MVTPDPPPSDCVLAVAWSVAIVAGAVIVTSIGFGPGTIRSAAHVTVSFDSLQRNVLPPEAQTNLTAGGSTIVMTMPDPLSLFRSSAMTWYVNVCCVATKRGASIDMPTSTRVCAEAEAAMKNVRAVRRARIIRTRLR